VLIRYADQYLLCDPWYERPAFGSWMSNPAMFVHPTYLVALQSHLALLISHGHDDHADDQLLRLFSEDTPVVTSDYESPGVRKRIENAGFQNVMEAGEGGLDVGPFRITSFRNEQYSLDDALYVIRTPDAVVVHANDVWREFPEPIIQRIRSTMDGIEEDRRLYMSQTNIASGFPLIYTCFDNKEKKRLQTKHITDMIRNGFQNASKVGARFFHTYAGMAVPFVKEKEEYLASSAYPSYVYIHTHLAGQIPSGLEVLDFYPGDTFDFSGVQRSFFDRNIYDRPIRESTIEYYREYGHLENCDSYETPELFTRDELHTRLCVFMDEFGNFADGKSARSDFYPSIVGKVLKIEIPDADLDVAIRFGEGLVDGGDFNKKIVVKSEIMWRVLTGQSLFEDLTTGYLAEVTRNPPEVYNRDIYIFIAMYSYYYKVRILKQPIY